jgi:hypothetical protein
MTVATETYYFDERGRRVILKDPGATLDYSADWRQWLAAIGDSLASHDAFAAADASITIDAVIDTAGLITAFASGGVVNELEPVTFHVETVGGRKDDRTIYLKIVQR